MTGRFLLAILAASLPSLSGQPGSADLVSQAL